MPLVFAELSHEEDRRRRRSFDESVRDFWLREADSGSACVRPCAFSPGVSHARSGPSIHLFWEDGPSRARAELMRGSAPVPEAVTLGGKRLDHPKSLAEAKRATGIDLASARVRVGLTRGHLFEVALSVPFDVPGSQEELEDAADVFLENLVGEPVLDDWVLAVSVTRVARTRGLVVLNDASSAATYPLELARDLIERGKSALEAERVVRAADLPAAWTALDVGPGAGGLHPDRRFASTLVPEALKAALEGLPFRSCRFLSGTEVFAWLAFEATRAGPSERARRHEERLERLDAHFRAEDDGRVLGTGFGTRFDYVDLAVTPEPRRLARLLEKVRADALAREFGFYDDLWREETIRVEPTV